jgi:hypothetical protein
VAADDHHALVAARAALAAAGLPFAQGIDPDEMAGTLARLLAITGPRLGAPQRAALPPREVAALLRAAEAVLDAEHRLRDAADRPPPLPVAYLDALLAWSGRVAIVTRRGAPERGPPFGARAIVSLYVRAFARRPSAAINGPSHRFVVACLGVAGAARSAKYRARVMLEVAGDVHADECLEFLRAYEPFESWLARTLKLALDHSH